MIRVATFNVHGFVGRDRRRDLVRTAAVISELECTAVGLQEVDSRTDDATIAALERRTGMRAMSGVTMASPVGDYGNLMLTTGRASEVRRHDLTVPGREPRGALEAKIEIAHESSLRMIVTHLGLRRSERRRQTMDLLRIVARLPAEREVVLAGDFNEWWPAAATLARLQRVFGRLPTPPTFPTPRPALALDRLWVRPSEAVRELRAHRTRLALQASDHLPLVASLELPAPAARPSA